MNMNEDGSQKKILNFDTIKARLSSFKDARAEDLELTLFIERWKKVIRVVLIVVIALIVYLGLRTLKDAMH